MKAVFTEASWVFFGQRRGLVWSAVRRKYNHWAMENKNWESSPLNPLSCLFVLGQGKVKMPWLLSGSKRRPWLVSRCRKYLTWGLQIGAFLLTFYVPFLLILRGDGAYPPKMLPLRGNRGGNHPHIAKRENSEKKKKRRQQHYQPSDFEKNRWGFWYSPEAWRSAKLLILF